MNLTAEQPGAVAAAVDKADPRKECIVLFTAAPPCQDFWRIGPAAGHDGERGGLFLKAVEFVNRVTSLLGDRRVGFMFENVVMEPQDAAKVSEAVGVQPVMVFASDFGWISRPRL